MSFKVFLVCEYFEMTRVDASFQAAVLHCAFMVDFFVVSEWSSELFLGDRSVCEDACVFTDVFCDVEDRVGVVEVGVDGFPGPLVAGAVFGFGFFYLFVELVP